MANREVMDDIAPTVAAESEAEQDSSLELTVPELSFPRALHILPLFERPFFPGQVMPILVKEDPWRSTVEQISQTPDRLAGVLLVKGDNASEVPRSDALFTMGTIIRLHEPKSANGMVQFIAEGLARFRLGDWISREIPYTAQVEYPGPGQEDADQVKAYGLAIINTVKELLPLNPLYGEELKMFLHRFDPSDPSPFADFAAALTSAKKEELQEILETVPILERMQKVLIVLKKELEVAKIQAQIRRSVDENISDNQRKFFLRQQLEEIQKELGISKDDKTAELERFRQRLEGAELAPETQRRIDEEMDKMAILELGSPEYGVTRNYLDWVSRLPWGRFSADKLDLKTARAVLDRDHEGLDDVKERIVEFLAVGVNRGEIGGSILLFIGPPGVGKTSIGRSIAEALGRKFFRFSLGGMRDEAEIKGHRRTYIGAMPGKFIQSIKECGVANPVIMLDEIDKVGASYHGDPASALLEVLDPEQNAAFLDHYLDLPFDLSKVLFVCTANQLDTIPEPLLDRMESIRLSGYIAREKVAIAKHHLWRRQLEKAGAKASEIKLSEAALRQVVEGYAREAGVRNLEKQLGRIIRQAVVKRLGGAKPPLRIGANNLADYLGPPRFRAEKPASGVGVVTGLAWTAMGGATLDVEAARIHGESRGLKLTGQLGDVMKESAEIAYSFVASHLESLGAKAGYFDEIYLHLHVPEGATPKDGPSAGVTMASALLSLARGRRLARKVAMTGELTLTGRVLPVGGIREKVIAARRIGVMELILPDDNRHDVDELPAYLKEGLTVHFAKSYRDVAEVAFTKK
ncbi:MAG TPA: endopeptidase La [Alphaproteobacteria bacterium]|nr:endopeptidase La [Alphaproteobacteria bacterium]MDP6270358.1 endopeptidase La [Alphaproteobacteria bacterium]MDP7429324.1 endopeptidase La [Alphaproteobacteria bacterium]HJM49265.1 endopeptidase La [Alphaproteobacteria bacterium]